MDCHTVLTRCSSLPSEHLRCRVLVQQASSLFLKFSRSALAVGRLKVSKPFPNFPHSPAAMLLHAPVCQLN